MAWDGIMCWPATLPGVLRSLPCPGYIVGFNPTVSCNYCTYDLLFEPVKCFKSQTFQVSLIKGVNLTLKYKILDPFNHLNQNYNNKTFLEQYLAYSTVSLNYVPIAHSIFYYFKTFFLNSKLA